MTQPDSPQPQTVTRRYYRQRDYDADVRSMNRSNWRVASVYQDANGDIVANFTPLQAPPIAPLSQRPPESSPVASGQPVAPQVTFQQSNPGRGLGFLLTILAGVIVIGILGGIVSNFASPASQSDQTTVDAQATTNAAIATATAVASQAYFTSIYATATAQAAIAPATPSAISAAQLGGPVNAFDSIYGPESSTDVWYVTLDGQSVMLEVQSSNSTSGQITTPDGSDRVFTIGVSFLGQTPTSAQRTAVCRRFLPSDARLISNNTSVNPTEHIYRSQRLAASFDTDAFQNNAGANVTPGTFVVLYSARECVMQTGME